jgi:hypothetical protein
MIFYQIRQTQRREKGRQNRTEEHVQSEIIANVYNLFNRKTEQYKENEQILRVRESKCGCRGVAHLKKYLKGCQFKQIHKLNISIDDENHEYMIKKLFH